MALAKEWDILANFESRELVRRDYLARHGRTPSARHALEISAPFSHARAYFRSAQAAEPTVKPLLLYYGVASLCRGLTLVLQRGLREAALAPSHGLSVLGWGQELSRDNPDFAALGVTVGGVGAFVEISGATGFRSLLRHDSTAVNYTYTNPTIPAGSAFNLGDLLSRLPALQDHHRRWRGGTLCLQPRIETLGEMAVIRFFKEQRAWVTRDVTEALMRDTPFTFHSEDAGALTYVGPNEPEAIPGLTDYVNRAFMGIGNLWLAALYPRGIKLSKLSTLFAVSYALGMLVRYYPMQWSALLKGQVNDAALPTLSAAVDAIEDDFPVLVLDFLGLPA